MGEFVMKRKDNYFWESILVCLAKPLVIVLIKSPITPNMVTLFNLLVIVPVICGTSVYVDVCGYVCLAIFVQIYYFLDVVDGNLARNKNMKSEFGRRLDIIVDTIFYTVVFFVIGVFACRVQTFNVLIAIFVQQLYGLTATYYIVPRIRKNDHFTHTKLKQYFIDKDIIFGMDASLECLIISIMLLFPFRKWIFVICPIMWAVDMVYRLYELKIVNKLA